MKYVLLIKKSAPDEWHILSCDSVDKVCIEQYDLIFKQAKFLTRANKGGFRDLKFCLDTATWDHFEYKTINDLIANNFSLIL